MPYNLLWESAFVGEVAFTLKKKVLLKEQAPLFR